MRRVYVADLKSSAFAGQTTRSKRRDSTLVRDLRQRVGLVHKLAELTRTKELTNRGTDRLGIDQIMRHEVLGLSLA